ncbi:MAG TPA: hypothetical protein VGC98_05765 [Thermoleophilaceae bacterium]
MAKGEGGAFAADQRDWLRLGGGLAFGIGALVLAVRKLGVLPGGDTWSDGALLVVLAVPFFVLYGLGMAGRTGGRDAEPWQSTFLVFATILAPLMLFQLLALIGGDANDSWNSVWILGLTGLIGVAATLYAGATQAAGFGALALIAAWLAFWDAVLDNPSGNTVRWLLVVIAAIYVVAAYVLARRGFKLGAGLITAAGLATGYAGILSSLGALSVLGPLPLPGPTARTVEAATPSAGWDAFLLVTSIALVAFSARTGRRGPGLVGGAGIVAFIVVVGGQLGDVLAGHADHALSGWPLLLLIVGAVGIVASFVIPRGAIARLRSHEDVGPLEVA